MPFPRLALVSLPLLLGAIIAPCALARPAYKGAIIVDAATGRTLFADNADEVSPPASMTKLMTFAVMDDRIRSGAIGLKSQIRITPEDARVAAQGDSSKVDLRAGEVIPLEELIYAMMIKSANDAAYAVGNAIGGNVPAFVVMMNAKARSLGMYRTTFRTPNGFPVPSHRIADGDLTTPRDFALLCRYLLLNTDILKYTSVKTRPFAAGLGIPTTIMSNHNNLLGKVAGVDGLKTGFTNGAGFCIAATARRGGRRVIVVLMDSPDSRGRDLKTAELIDRGFAMLPLFSSSGATARPTGDPALRSPVSPPTLPVQAPSAPNAGPPSIQFNLPR
jgi:D-alanyl-D-alanine carboxypeptidase (penicillin-binding protein 5/6)